MLSRQERSILFSLLALALLGLGWWFYAWVQGARLADWGPAPVERDVLGQDIQGQDTGQVQPPHLPEEGVGAGTADLSPEAPPPETTGQDPEHAETPDVGVTVHVAGAVAKPGVYRLVAGSRVIDAVAAAGGPTADGAPDALNLAEPLRDAMRIYVPTKDEVREMAAGLASSFTSPALASAGQPVVPVIDINRATAAELEALPGVGPVLARRLVDFRAQHGPYRRPEDLLQVTGIGPKLLERLRPFLVFP